MLSDEERRSMLEMGRSSAVREEFDRVRTAGRQAARKIDAQQLVAFLTMMTRLGSDRIRPRPFVPYTRVLL